MFKSKKNRDSALLIFMGLVLILFLIYLFFPAGDREKSVELTDRSQKKKKVLTENPISNEIQTGEIVETPEKFLKDVKNELISIQEVIASGDSPFFPPPADSLEELFRSEKKWDTKRSFDKILKFRFRDVGKIFDVDFPEKVENSAKFDIYIALFLISANNEMINAGSADWTLEELSNNTNFKPYSLINFEVQEDYQTIPLYFYTALYVKKDPVFPPPEEIRHFFKQLDIIRDLSPGQTVNSIKTLSVYSEEIKNFSIFWKEYDPLDPDDTGIYRGVKTTVQKWIKYKFIIYPGNSDLAWIKHLVTSDRGEFELEDLEISEEIAGEKRIARNIFYSKNLSKFIVIIDDPVIFSVNGQVDRIFKSRIEEIKKSFIRIDMLDRYRDKKKFKNQLLEFGKYLYGIKDLFLKNFCVC